MLDIPTERYTLDNGLRVVLSLDRTAPIVGVNLWYLVGSRNERQGRTGFAHLFEHMMFQGSAHVAKGGHFELIERAGGTLNASTWFDRTNYFETVPSHQLELALWLESDRMGWMVPAMTQEKLDNQRDVVTNEKRERYDNQPYGDWDEHMQEMVFPATHPYHHTVIGSMEDLDAATLEDVGDFFSTFYVPNNAVLTLCGDFDPTEVRELIERYFGSIPAGAELPPIPGDSNIETLIGETVRRRVEAEVPLPRVYMAARIPPYTTEAFYSAEVAASVLGVGRASRLYRSLVRERKIANDVVSFAFPLITGASLLLVWATGYAHVTPEELEAALSEEFERLGQTTRQEVDRAIAVTETRLVKELERVATRADLLSMFETLYGDAGRLNGELDRLRAVTPAELNEFAASHLGPENRAVLTYVPQGAS